jgi:hypothetical protein
LLAGLAIANPVAAIDLSVGETRARLTGSLAASHVFRLDPDTPRERPSGTLDIRLEADRGRHVHVFLDTRVGYDGKIGDPDRGNPVIDLDEIHQDRDVFVSFEEAYVDLAFRRFELRVGKQKVSWGRLDEIQPTDNLNPEDLSEFLFRPELERKIGIPAIKLSTFLEAYTAELVWAPFFTAYRFPNRRDRWFPPLLTVPGRVDTPLGSVPIRVRYPDVREPPLTLASSDVGMRIQRAFGEAETSLSVFHGWDKTSTFGTRGAATVVPTGMPGSPVAPSIDLDIVPKLHRITVLGGDLAVPIWVLALRAEAAWIHGRFFPVLIGEQLGRDPRLVGVVRDTATRVLESGRAETVALPLAAAELERNAVQYGVGFDYTVSDGISRRLTGGHDWLARGFILVQLIETVMFDHDAPFIADQVEHLLGLTLRQTFRDDRLLAEVKVAYNPNHGDFFVWPQLAYKLMPNLHVLFEARVLGGSATQTIGQYRKYDGIRIGLKRYF